jgi:DNA-binding transcriptional MerR regulator
MMRIGEFARLSRVSVKTLQYYDELGLIKPARVDEFTGYRYYAHDQYGRLNRLLALKDLGFSLEHIRRLLDGGLSADQVRRMLADQAEEIRGRLQADQGRLARLEAWLTQMKMEDEMSDYEIIVKRVPAITAACVRSVVPAPAEQSPLWEKVINAVTDKTAISNEPCITLYYDEEPKEQDWDIEVCLPLVRRTETAPGVGVRDLPVVESMASVVHKGPFMTISTAYDALASWVGSHGYRVNGPAREIVLHATHDQDGKADQASPDTVVEVQFPVEIV